MKVRPIKDTYHQTDYEIEVLPRATTQWDKLAWIVLAALFVLMLAATWQRWTNPIIDHGREMNLPTRILAGEKLYVDILYYYGPFAPYFNALLYRVFGIHLSTLHASGLVCAVSILAMIYWLARQLMSVWGATLATAIVMLSCAFNVYLGSYIQPYSYAALYGFVFALASLVCAVRYLQTRHRVQLCLGGISAGLVMICKPELGTSAIVPPSIALAFVCFTQRRLLWREAMLLTLPILVICGVIYGFILIHVPWQTLLRDNYEIFSSPQVVHFYRHLNGLLDWPKTGWALLSAIGVILCVCGLSALLAILASAASGQWRYILQTQAWRAWGAILIGFPLWKYTVKDHDLVVDPNPLRASLVILLAVIPFTGWRCWSTRARDTSLKNRDVIFLIIALFGLVSIARVFLNVSLINSYTPFTIPALVIVHLYLIFRISPACLLPAGPHRQYAEMFAMAIVGMAIFALAVNYIPLSRRQRTYEISTSRGRQLVEPYFGRPLSEAMRFAQEQTRPGEYLLSFPQGTSVNFLIDRPYPLKEENIVPGFLTGARETDAIRRIAERRVPLILIGNLPTPEYRDRAFGVDYNQNLMRWINEHYHLVATFGPTDGLELRLGDPRFFILAYKRK
jgi:4-amino-4-deoxy-L-arabinose transferase-like glycosyltransferase